MKILKIVSEKLSSWSWRLNITSLRLRLPPIRPSVRPPVRPSAREVTLQGT